MGVLGLTPFLQKHCPEVIKSFPERLRSLKGKTIVIDGTLITQRLHFVPAPHRRRHVLGWYRLITELRESDVRTICVFDGKERNFAKALEVQRRKETRRVTAVRSAMESERLQRLHKLSTTLKAYYALPPHERERATQTLRSLIANANKPTLRLSGGLKTRTPPFSDQFGVHPLGDLVVGESTPTSLDMTCEGNCTVFAIPSSEEPMATACRGARLQNNALSEIARLSRTEPVSWKAVELCPNRSSSPKIPPDSPVYISGELELGASSMDRVPASERGLSTTAEMTPQDILAAFSSLYQEYRLSHPPPSLQTDLPSPAPNPDMDTEDSSISDDERLADVAESRTQQQLTLAEGELWQALAVSVSAPDVDATAALALLADKSQYVSESYERRSRPPTSETYAESREILDAMGIPCIESTGEFEAEALAAALVLGGHADFVASEDTDVLIYGAPLVRNITNRKVPLVTIAGADVRAALQLDPAPFVDFALLLGTDFARRIRGVGPARALRFIREHETIERIVGAGCVVPTPAYLEQVERARGVFGTLPPLPGAEIVKTRACDDAAVRRILWRYGLARAIQERDWDYGAGLAGNFFGDDPLCDSTRVFGAAAVS